MKKRDIEVIRKLIDDRSNERGIMKRKPENEFEYRFRSVADYDPQIQLIKPLGFNVRYFVESGGNQTPIIDESHFTADKVYTTYYMETINGNIYDPNLVQNANAVYVTEVYTDAPKTIPIELNMPMGVGGDNAGSYCIWIDGSFFLSGYFRGPKKLINLQIPGGEFVRIAIFIHAACSNPVFATYGDMAMAINGWRLPPTPVPTWEQGYPTNRKHADHIELKWDTDSIYSVGESAITVIESASTSGGPYEVIGTVNYDTDYYVQTALDYNEAYWYRLKTTDITAYTSAYSTIKNGSTVFGNFPLIGVSVKKNNADWAYYKSGDTADIRVVSNVSLSDEPTVVIVSKATKATGEASCYATDELSMMSSYYYQAIKNTFTTVSGSSPAIMPEGTGSVYAHGNVFGTSPNLASNGNFGSRYLDTGGSSYIEVSGWYRSGYEYTTTYPNYYYADDDTGAMGSRYVKVGGPTTTGSAANHNENYDISGAKFYQYIDLSESTATGYVFSAYMRIDDGYDVSLLRPVSGWKPLVMITYYSGASISGGNLTAGTEIGANNHYFAGTRQWARNYVVPSVPANTDAVKIELTSMNTRNYFCDGDFQNYATWWTLTGGGGADYIASGKTDATAPTSKCLFLSGDNGVYVKQTSVLVSGLPSEDITISLQIKPTVNIAPVEINLKYRDKLNTGAWGHVVATSGITRAFDETIWSRVQWHIDSSYFVPTSVGMECEFVIPSGQWYLAGAQIETGTSATTWIPGDLRVNFDGIMFESGNEPSNTYKNKEDEFGAYNSETVNIYFDYTNPVGGFYVSTTDNYTSNNAQAATLTTSVYLLTTGTYQGLYPYDYYGIRYVYFIDSGELAATGSWTRFDYVQGQPYQWTLETTGAGTIGTGTGPRRVYSKFEDMAGNVSTTDYDDIIYINGSLLAPSGLTVTGDLPGSNWAKWLPITGYADPYNLLDSYEVRAWDLVGHPTDTDLSIWDEQTTATGARHTGLSAGATDYYAVRCKDIAGQWSAWSDVESCTSYDFDDAVSPDYPFVSGLDSDTIETPFGANVRIQATIGHSGYDEGGIVSCTDLRSITAGIRTENETSYGNTKIHTWDTPPTSFPTGIDFNFAGLAQNTYYYVSALATDWAGNTLGWCTPSGILTAIESNPPDAVAWFSLSAMYNKIMANWELSYAYDIKDFVMLRGDLWKTSGELQADTAARAGIFTLEDRTNISGDFVLVIDPDGGSESRFLISGDGAAANTVVIKGINEEAATLGMAYSVFEPLTIVYRGPWTDENLLPSTTYYYNLFAVDTHDNVSLPYSQHMTITGYTDWPSATTKDVNDVGLEWDFLADTTTINKLKNSSFEIPSGASSARALFWTTYGGDFRDAAQQKYGSWSAKLDDGERIKSDPFKMGPGEVLISFYGRQASTTANSWVVSLSGWNGASWTNIETISTGASASNVWQRPYATGLVSDSSTVSGAIYIKSVGTTSYFDAIMLQEGDYLTQYIPYADEFVLGTAMIGSVEIYPSGILAPNIAANTIQAKHILAGAVGAHHITVANRKYDASDLHFYPNRDYPGPWNLDTSEPWPVGDTDWVPSGLYWTSGTVNMQSGESSVGTINRWNSNILVPSGAALVAYDSMRYVCLDYPVTSSGEPADGPGVISLQSNWANVSSAPDADSGRFLIGKWYTGTGDLDPTGGRFESVDVLGTTIYGENIQTGTIEARLITAGAVHAEHISADQITGTHISGGSINAGHIEVGSRARAYGHNLKFVPDLDGMPTLYTDAGEVWVTGLTFNVSADHYVYANEVDTNEVYYFYYDTQSEIVWYTGEEFANELASGYKVPLASFRYTTDTPANNAFEVEHIRAWGTYMDGSHLSTSSISAAEIMADAITAIHIEADAIDAGHISADAIESKHISGELLEGLAFHATIPGGSGDLWINSGGTAGDFRVYDGDGNIRVEIGLDTSDGMPEIPQTWYGFRINNGFSCNVATGGNLDLSDWDSAQYDWLKYPAMQAEMFYDQTSEWNTEDAVDENLSGLHRDHRFICKTSNAEGWPWCGSWQYIWNAYGPIAGSTTYYPAGVYGNVNHAHGNGFAYAHHDYGAGTFDAAWIAHKHAVVAVHGSAVGTLPGASYRGGDIVGGAFRGSADYLSDINVGTYTIGVLATAYCANFPSRAIALWTYGNIMQDGSKAVGNKIITSGMDYYSADGLTRLGLIDSGGFSELNIQPTGHVAIGLAKITQDSNLIYLESGFKMPSGETIYVGDISVKQVGGNLAFGNAYVTPQGRLIPTGTVYEATTLGNDVVGEEWNALYLNSGGGEKAGIYWNYSDGAAMNYAAIFSRNDSLYSRMNISQTYNGATTKIQLDAKSKYIEFSAEGLIPLTDNATCLGTGGKEFKDLFLDGTAYIDTLEIHDAATLLGYPLVSQNNWDKNGFEDRNESTLAWDDGTRTLTVEPTGSNFSYWVTGGKFTTTGDNVQIDDTEGIHAIYYDGNTLTALANPTSANIDTCIRTKALASLVYWSSGDSKAIYVGEERHGDSMSPATHAYLHFGEGLKYLSGLALTGILSDETGNDNSHCKFGIAVGAVADEDIYHSISAVDSGTGLPLYYMSGSTPAWIGETGGSGFSIRTYGGTPFTRLAYNEYTGGAWQLTEIANASYVLYHVFATTEKDNPMICIMGQNEYTNKTSARTGAKTEIHSLLLDDILFPEIRPVATIIFQTQTSYTSDKNARIVTTDDGEDYIDWRSEIISRVALTTSEHNSLSALQGGAIGAYYHLDATEYGHLDGQDQGVSADSIVEFKELTVTGNTNFFDASYTATKNTTNQTTDAYMMLPGGVLTFSTTTVQMCIPVPTDGYIKSLGGHCNIDSFGASDNISIDMYTATGNDAATIYINDCTKTVESTGFFAWTKVYTPTDYPVSKGERIVLRWDVVGTIQYDHPTYNLVIRCTGEGD